MCENPSQVGERVEGPITAFTHGTAASASGTTILNLSLALPSPLLASGASNVCRELVVGEDGEVVRNDGWKDTIDSNEMSVTNSDHLVSLIFV